MEYWIDYLTAHPAILLGLVIVLCILVFTVIKKLLKIALIAAIIFIALSGFTYKKSQSSDIIKELKKNAKDLKEQVIKKGKKELEKIKEEAVDEVKKELKHKLSN